MAIDQLVNAWQSYRTEVDRFYEVFERAQPALEEEQPIEDELLARADAALASAADSSVNLREVCEGLLAQSTNRAYDEVALRLTAAAAVDTLLAGDALRLSAGEGEPDSVFVERARAVELEPRQEVLGEADLLFGPLLDSLENRSWACARYRNPSQVEM